MSASKFATDLVNSVNRKEVAEAIVKVQAYLAARGVNLHINKVSTLVRSNVEVLQEQLSMLCGDDLTFDESGEVIRFPAEVAEVVKIAEERSKVGAKGLFGYDDVVTVLDAAFASKARDDSGSGKRLHLLKSGMTVRQFVSAVESETGSSKGARRTLRKLAKRSLVAINAVGG